MRGQLSAEMLVVLVLVLGLAIFLASVMFKSAGQAAGKIEEKTGTVLEAGEKNITKSSSGQYCVEDADCESGYCTASRCE